MLCGGGSCVEVGVVWGCIGVVQGWVLCRGGVG